MKKILTICILTMFYIGSIAQGISIEYHHNYTLDLNSIKKQFKTIGIDPIKMEKILHSMSIENDKNIVFIYVLNKANFRSQYLYSHSFIPKHLLTDDYIEPKSKSSSWVCYQKDLRSKKLILKGQLMENSIEVDFQDFKWEVFSDSTKVICNFNCTKAVGIDPVSNNRIVAYFTEQIPLSDGPEYYGGLAGQILQIINNDSKITASKIESLAKVDEFQEIKDSEKGRLKKYLNTNKTLMTGMATVRPN